MVEQDTVRLLRECDAGIQMGVSSIDEVLDSVRDDALRELLTNSRREHERLGAEIADLLGRYHDDGKAPNPVAKGMSWMKTHTNLAVDGSDEKVADLATDGCNMGAKSLSRYLRQYQAADEQSKDIAKRLIRIEDQLTADLRRYL